MHPSISGRIAQSIDPANAAPLYHQVAEVVRWEISQGRLPIGALLPPVREVAARAGINYHTVRRAWSDLEVEGVLSLRRGRGATVVREPRRGGWTPAGAPSTDGPAAARIWVVAASLEEAAQLALVLSGRWRVEAIPWPREADAPPPGPILCTAVVAEPVQARWPGRGGDLRAVPSILDQVTLGVLRRNAALLGVTRVWIHADQSEPAVRELLRQLPRVGLQVALAAGDQEPAPGAAPDALSLYFPAAWAAQTREGRMHPHAVAAATEWAAGPLAGVARELGWVVR